MNVRDSDDSHKPLNEPKQECAFCCSDSLIPQFSKFSFNLQKQDKPNAQSPSFTESDYQSDDVRLQVVCPEISRFRQCPGECPTNRPSCPPMTLLDHSDQPHSHCGEGLGPSPGGGGGNQSDVGMSNCCSVNRMFKGNGTSLSPLAKKTRVPLPI